jgi:hypothetical protein
MKIPREKVKEGDIIQITSAKRPYNWSKRMDIFKGTLHQVTKVYSVAGKAQEVFFVGSGGWSWRVHDKHFEVVYRPINQYNADVFLRNGAEVARANKLEKVLNEMFN